MSAVSIINEANQFSLELFQIEQLELTRLLNYFNRLPETPIQFIPRKAKTLTSKIECGPTPYLQNPYFTSRTYFKLYKQSKKKNPNRSSGSMEPEIHIKSLIRTSNQQNLMTLSAVQCNETTTTDKNSHLNYVKRQSLKADVPEQRKNKSYTIRLEKFIKETVEDIKVRKRKYERARSESACLLTVG